MPRTRRQPPGATSRCEDGQFLRSFQQTRTEAAKLPTKAEKCGPVGGGPRDEHSPKAGSSVPAAQARSQPEQGAGSATPLSTTEGHSRLSRALRSVRSHPGKYSSC